MARTLEWLGIVWLALALLLPLAALGFWIADRLDRFAERWCRA